ncbi:hypothetical protein SEEA1981_07240 [Salmonella enterica subsp. enterica serovar Agona str. 241981]|nr:hypothetical protein SEEA1981_07240 [Salmonella enterica subsp. enterica serovar Agona str. 241981]
MKLGVPFTLIVMAVCIVMIPMLFPFNPRQVKGLMALRLSGLREER